MHLARDPRYTFKNIAKGLYLSTTSAINIFMEHCPKYIVVLPTVISIDEIYLGRKSLKKYAVVIMDFNTQKIIDLIYGCSLEDCMSVVGNYPRENRLTVKYVTSDMYTGFHRLVKSYFPHAEILYLSTE